MKRRWVLVVFKDTGRGWIDHNAFRLSAALAYYTLFSVAPVVLIAISLAGLVFGRTAAQHQLSAQFARLLGPESAMLIEQLVAHANHVETGIIATIVSVATVLLGATAVFSELQDALNMIWDVGTKPGRTVLKLLRDRVFSFALVLCLGFLLLVSLVVSAGLAAIGEFATQILPQGISSFTLQVAHASVAFVVTAVLFALMFKVLPDVRLRFRDALIGGTVTAILFSLGRIVIGEYLGRSGVASPFGAAGSLVALIVWVYYSSLILYLGAEFTRAYTLARGIHVAPTNLAGGPYYQRPRVPTPV